MSGLRWGRLDGTLWGHEKMVALEGERDGALAFRLYVYALSWSIGTGNDGYVPTTMLPILRAKPAHASALVRVRLWEDDPRGGWQIRNYGERQQLSALTDRIRENLADGGARAACARWMVAKPGRPCTCGHHADADAPA